MPYADPLTDDEVVAALEGLPAWSREGESITRTVETAGFVAAIALVNAVAGAAEAADHHPDICITRYRRATFTLTTHAARGITRRDLELAAEIDRLVTKAGG